MIAQNIAFFILAAISAVAAARVDVDALEVLRDRRHRVVVVVVEDDVRPADLLQLGEEQILARAQHLGGDQRQCAARLSRSVALAACRGRRARRWESRSAW